MKTLTELRDRPLYRLLKIIYIFCFAPIFVMAYIGLTESSTELTTYAIFFILILEVFKRIIFYIFLGTMRPPEK